MSEVIRPCFGSKAAEMSEIAIKDLRQPSEVEVALLQLIRELLHNERVGPEDNFFLVGGHSMLGTELVMRARKAFGVKVSVNDLFEAGTVARLALLIEEMILDDVESMSEEDLVRASVEA